MRFASRINSFKKSFSRVEDIIKALSKIDGLTDIEFNLPEHIEKSDYSEIKKLIQDSGKDFSGAAVRFRSDFIDGELGYEKNRHKAIDQAKAAIDNIVDLGGSCLTVWLAYDGFDYSFQIDYQKHWEKMIESFQQIADYNKDLKVSIEYKPWEPRAYSLMPNVGTTMHAINCIDRDNMGLTVDYCHSLMAGENPAFSLALAGMQNKLYGIHLNDGNGFADDGHVFGSTSLVRSFEFMYYLKKMKYDDLIYFDTFPIREDPVEETVLNLRAFKAIEDKIDAIGLDKLADYIENEDLSGQRFVLDNLL